ncbi:hypothetical protein GCM10022381_23560 [Leifsonia kafniensis]|uniref:HTH marR-type domain-containing protein n=1 Tax=Leifsonia kafniensis TaxID=475957 RepID=A0ABP7KLK9_9MICO
MNDSSQASVDRALTVALREFSWAVHRRPPERASVRPMPTTAIAMLKQVVDAPGSTVGDLAHELGLQQPNASATLRVLLQHGYVTREPGLDDRRIVRIMPTELGTQEQRAVSEAWAGSLDEALAALSEERRATLHAALEAIEEISHLLLAGVPGTARQ